ncbi:MAG: right-handed parallel beta-helix repeat-containing protein [Alphaproteobacteria bacterium]|nr:right-handed parallel beta-helix repeat-containing protein [Alphaproteobacteria bacterium]
MPAGATERADPIYVEQCGEGPIVLSGLRGTYEHPIVVTRKTDGVITLTKPDLERYFNTIAFKRQEAGYYPSVGQNADDAALILRNCQFVLIRDLQFVDCWPTALYLDECQNIAVMDCEFQRGTIAIGANGRTTRDLLIEGCTFAQTEPGEMWNDITWESIHGSFDNANYSVDLCDGRHSLDGDFFRAWDIVGHVTLRGNTIRDAFNGIHFFNRVDRLEVVEPAKPPRYNSDRKSANTVLIENNWFERVRDNCIEPEAHAWNWVVRGNRFADCYTPYSFEIERGGWFYIYDNHHWLMERPGSKTRFSGSGFKTKGTQLNDGDFYVFNNSWLFNKGERTFRKQKLGRLKHHNNAIKDTDKRGRFFGSHSLRPTPGDDAVKAEEKRFTRRWATYQIEMNGDWIWDGQTIEAYRKAGYGLGDETQARDPGFRSPTGPEDRKSLKPGVKMAKAGVAWTMLHPAYEEASRRDDSKHADRYRLEIAAGGQVGAGLPQDQRRRIDAFLTFVPSVPFRM